MSLYRVFSIKTSYLHVRLIVCAILLLALSLPVAFSQSSVVIKENKFNSYFSPIGLQRYTLAWNNGEVMLSMLENTTVPPDWWTSHVKGLMSADSTLDDSIPSTTSLASYSLDFRIMPEGRSQREGKSFVFMYGDGWDHVGSWGSVDTPLFYVYLNTADNHVYFEMAGYITNWNYRGNIYAFGSYTVLLGSVEEFVSYRTFTVWINVTDQSFSKFFLDQTEIPLPTGYLKIQPTLYMTLAPETLWGFKVGDNNGAQTNIHVYFDNITLRAGYWSPSITGGIPIEMILALVLLLMSFILGYTGKPVYSLFAPVFVAFIIDYVMSTVNHQILTLIDFGAIDFMIAFLIGIAFHMFAWMMGHTLTKKAKAGTGKRRGVISQKILNRFLLIMPLVIVISVFLYYDFIVGGYNDPHIPQPLSEPLMLTVLLIAFYTLAVWFMIKKVR